MKNLSRIISLVCFSIAIAGCASTNAVVDPSEFTYQEVTAGHYISNFNFLNHITSGLNYERSLTNSYKVSDVYIVDFKGEEEQKAMLSISSSINMYGSKSIWIDATDFFMEKAKSDEPYLERWEYSLFDSKKYNGHYTMYLYSIKHGSSVETFLYALEGVPEQAQVDAEKAEQARIEKEKEKEERRLAEEAKKKAYEEANKYDPNDFYYIADEVSLSYDETVMELANALVGNNSSSGFKPADYEEIDIFKGVSKCKSMKPGYTLFGYGYPTYKYVSDAVFINQNETNITFKSEDNAITARMKIGGRSGMSKSEKVKVYYRCTDPYTMTVIAIKKIK